MGKYGYGEAFDRYCKIQSSHDLVFSALASIVTGGVCLFVGCEMRLRVLVRSGFGGDP